MAQITFGECLSLLLSALDMSANRLSRAINVDGSLISRWIRGERVPSYRSNYIDDMASYLAQNVLHSLQIQQIDRLCIKTFGEIRQEDSTRDKIRRLLLEAQGYSLEARKQMEKKKSVFRKQAVVPFTSLSSDNKIISGQRQISALALSMLEAASSRSAKRTDTIRFSLLHTAELFPMHADWARLGDMLTSAIRNGWSVICLMHMDRNMERLVRLTDFASRLIQTGHFTPYLLQGSDAASMGRELLIVPGEGALSCLATSASGGIDRAFFMKDPVAVEVFSDYFLTIQTTAARAGIDYYAESLRRDYARGLLASEQAAGKRLYIASLFSTLTLPDLLFEKLCAANVPAEHQQSVMANHREQVQAFRSNLPHFEHREIYSLKAIEEWMHGRKYAFWNEWGMQMIRLETADLIQHLQYVIHLLTAYEHFHIALEHRTESPSNHHYYFMMKEYQAIVLSSRQEQQAPEIRGIIREPMLVRAFEQYFADQWESIAPVNRDKQSILHYLRSKLRVLEQEHRPPIRGNSLQ
ncbi:helix-turn-helix transcriptional regulator [Paenibacillus sp. YN15]|uniref:helix-turn-helix domain-containing protein n=1 Tax=Paenibacillus sp. YN15 TaxID=1742774 RepID=UPI000DCB8FC4|nr:helix-turn-helix transcriptional regulator [Paenibacillus sp. YN15]RAU99191.1 hypothetical protein DQG13_16200 [Paenibacillus sp. YN15]